MSAESSWLSWLWWLALVGVVLLAVVLGARRRLKAAAPIAQPSGPIPADQVTPVAPRGYSPKNVGNDASARPWESSAYAPADAAAPVVAPALERRSPDGFDEADFLSTSKANFLHLQSAWDQADLASLRAMMTDGMLEQIRQRMETAIAARQPAEADDRSTAPSARTEVVMLEARLLGIEEMADAWLASVEFSGLMREDLSAGPSPFREIWDITRPRHTDGGWLVAGVQALR